MRAAIVCMLLVLGCSDGTTARLTVHDEPGWLLDRFEVGADGQRRSTDVSSTVRVLLPDHWAGQPLPIELWGLRGDKRWAYGASTITPVRGKEVSGVIVMARVPCGAWCTLGATSCSGDGVATCTQRDSDQCFVWSSATPCPKSAPYCSNGACAAACVDECASGERRCAGPGAIQRCGQSDSDPCNDWLPSTPCPDGQVCSGGSCVAACHDECKLGETQCSGDAVITCGDFNGDGCFEWGPAVPCASGTSCSKGACASQCTDECSAGQSQCMGTQLAECGQYDSDPCLDLSPGVSCVPSDPCMAGMCTANGCETAPKVCQDPPASTCIDANTLRVYDAMGQCMANGACDYASHDTACPNCPSCMDACAGVTCTTPPAPTCTSATTLRTYASSGTCSNGTCDYAYQDTTCSGGCVSGKCVPKGYKQVSAGCYYSCGLKTDGSVVCWGNAPAAAPAGSFTQISAGATSVCGVKSNGTVACWGDNQDGESSPPTGTFTSVSVGAASSSTPGLYACGVHTDGTIACWGGNAYHQASPPAGSFTAVAAGGDFTCGIASSGALACWGSGAYGETMPPSGTFSSVAGSNETACGVKADGTLVCWGQDTNGAAQPPSGVFKSADVGYQTFGCAVKSDGTLACWGHDTQGDTQPPSGSFAAVSTGCTHACALKADGTLACWGENTFGEATPPPP